MRNFIESLKLGSDRHITLTKIIYEANRTEQIRAYLSEFGCDPNKLQYNLTQILNTSESIAVLRDGATAQIMETVEEVLSYAEKITGSANIDFRSFLYAMIEYSNEVSGDTEILIALQEANFDFNRFMNQYESRKQRSTSPDESMIATLCSNLNEQAKNGKIDPVIGRDDEILKTMEILAKRKKNNVVLTGRAGVGKTAIAEGLALAVSQGNVPEALKNATIYCLELGNMIAGTELRGSFEKKIMQLLEEFKEKEASGEFPILFIDELHTIVGGSGSNGLNFSNIIKPALSRGELRCIGATTDEEWSKFFHEEKALKRRFTVVPIVEPTRDQTIEILKGAKKYYEEKHGVSYSDEALVKCVDLSIEFMPDQCLPDKSLDLFDYSGAVFKLKEEKEINTDQVEYSLARMKKVSLDAIKAKREEYKHEPMSPKIKKNLFGQDQAVDRVVKAVEKFKAGLKRPDKPIGSFLFIGPTGVGKTELAKMVSKEMNVPLERIDMSEFMEAHSVSKFLGSPSGYVRSDEQSKMSKIFEKHSRFVLLLDEIEKAHPKVLEILLQIMDHAKVTDSKDQALNFNEVLILMTSNVGASELSESKIGMIDEKKVEKKINKRIIESSFTPEFRNRLTDILIFNSLNEEMILGIVKKSFKEICQDPLLLRGVKVSCSPDLITWIRDQSYDSNMGARPIERFIDSKINEEITQSILYGEILKGKKEVNLSVKNNELVFDYL